MFSVCAALWFPMSASPQSDVVSLRTLLSHRTVVEQGDAEPGRLARLPLGREVVAQCLGDLSDLRLLAGDGLVSTFLRREAVRARQSQRVAARVLSARRGADGNRSDDPAISQSESYELAPPSSWTDDGTWKLEVWVDPTLRSSFARDLELAWTDGGPASPQRTQTLFRLQDGRERSTFDLPARTASTLRVQLVGLDEVARLDPLEPKFFFVRERQIEHDPPTLEFELELEPVDDDGFSLSVHLPGRFFADALRFESSTGNFLRRVTVGERTSEGAVAVLTRGWIQSSTEPGRTQTLPLGIRRHAPAAMDARSELLLDIDGGDSPPLEQLRVFAVLPQPELVFEWPVGAERLDLYFGGGRVQAARFDLEEAAGRRRSPAESADLTWELLGEAVLPAARHGAVEVNPSFDPAPLLAFLQRPGAVLDLDAFRHHAALELTDGATGLFRIPLPVEALSRVQRDFADLRFVPSNPQDDTAAQWPYLVEPAARWTIELEAGSPENAGPGMSRTRLDVPEDLRSQVVSALRPRSLRLVLDQPYFDRDVLLETLGADGSVHQLYRRITTSSASDAFYEPNRRTSSVVLPVDADFSSTHAIVAFALEVENGDDAPARITHAELSGEGWQALLVAPPGHYRALIGATGTSELLAPSYELQRAADFVTALRGTEITLGELEPNPAAQSPGWLSSWSGNWQQVGLWAAILIAILALGWITLRSVAP